MWLLSLQDLVKKHQDQPCSKFWALESGSYDIMMLVPGAVPLERPPFSVLNSAPEHIFTNDKKKKKSREHHHFTVFAALETIIFKISLPLTPSVATHGPFTEASWTQNVCSVLWVYSWPECQQYASYKSAQETPISCLSLLRSSTFARSSMLWSPAFSCSTRSKAPIFHFAVAHTYQNLGRGPPHPDASLQISD